MTIGKPGIRSRKMALGADASAIRTFLTLKESRGAVLLSGLMLQVSLILSLVEILNLHLV